MAWVMRNVVGVVPWYMELILVVEVGARMVILLMTWVLRNVVGGLP